MQPGHTLDDRSLAPLDLGGVAGVHRGLGPEALIEAAVRRCEGSLAATGGLVVETGVHTGRSALDKFIVRDESNADTIWWDNNGAMERQAFEALRQDFEAHLRGKDVFVQDLHAGADPAHLLPVRIVTELAWHALFIRYLLRRPQPAELEGFEPAFTVVNCPSFKADPARHGCRSETVIAVDLAGRLVLIGGTSYAGETKKSVFGILNYLLPERGVMPMHCSANTAPEGGNAAIFFGLSGTGKTTLSSDPARTLIGDDEHGWSDDGIFNFEGGCYAKTIRLSATAEPEIHAATTRFGTVLENVVMDPETRWLDFDDARLAENARSAYPMHFIPNASETGRAGHPRTIIMLTADAFGVLPPIARLSAPQAMVYFLSGYTAKVAGTEKGVREPTATFSTCFGAPFMPRHPSVYADLLRERMSRHGSTCWLVNTGWTGGAHGEGRRMPIEATRALLAAALDGSLDRAAFRADPNFGFEVPVAVRGLDPALLDPRSTWTDGEAYDRQAAGLVGMFAKNFEKFRDRVSPEVSQAAPKAA